MTHLFLKDPSLTMISVPSCIDMAMCISVGSEACCWILHVSGNGVVVFCFS